MTALKKSLQASSRKPMVKAAPAAPPKRKPRSRWSKPNRRRYGNEKLGDRSRSAMSQYHPRKRMDSETQHQTND